MAGTLVVDTLKSGTSSPPAFQNTSGTEIGTLCRAWVNFDGTGTPAIRASFNVSSITDNGTGDYAANITNALPNANYCPVASGKVSGGPVVVAAANTASICIVRCFTSTTGAFVDADQCTVAIFR
jgi:hypothetical protein